VGQPADVVQVLEEMRRGAHPKDAALEALRRVKANTIEKRLLNPQGNPNFNLVFYALNVKGQYAGVSMYAGVRYALCTADGPRLTACESLLQGRPDGT
jgi:N4-(beta-N-acetylglucosaminyl)-L-asparaginase